MATATRTTTDAKTRSLELAIERGHTICSWAARRPRLTLDETTGDLVAVTWSIESASSQVWHVVTYQAATDSATCDCPAAQHRRPCWHAGLGLLKGRYLARLYSAEGRAEAAREYARDLAHEDNARCLGYAH